MIYKYLTTNDENQKIYARIDEDGLCRVTCTENDTAFLAWLEAGNTPHSADGTTNLTPLNREAE